MRSRGCEGNSMLGTEPAWAQAGLSHTPAAVVAHCRRKRLRVVVSKRNSLTDGLAGPGFGSEVCV